MKVGALVITTDKHFDEIAYGERWLSHWIGQYGIITHVYENKYLEVRFLGQGSKLKKYGSGYTPLGFELISEIAPLLYVFVLDGI